MGVYPRKMNELRSLLDNGGNTEKVLSSVEQFKMALNEFNDAHAAVQMLLPVEIKENETIDWYEPKMEIFKKSLSEIDLWKTSSSDQILRCLLNLMIVFPMCLNSPSNPNVQNRQDNQQLHQYLRLTLK